ncbi:HNH endonuclease family protein [Allonocardiopsis opalescens]|uniref:Uncharacterized protein DUF1524 n=1 Tax=Allonocardiopsis opalescens TaxID=1144618 RepID=A0A2T0Q465_9ACTN|nr:HNH endonuclease family protein [Allonocardiopsis opalescens]PRX98594.1 uncharacterized protein DUF1524 [Allonocardiopsis opalescens]
MINRDVARTSRPRDAGGSAIQYASLIVLAGILMSALWAANLGGVGTHTTAALCTLLRQPDCAAPAQAAARADDGDLAALRAQPSEGTNSEGTNSEGTESEGGAQQDEGQDDGDAARELLAGLDSLEPSDEPDYDRDEFGSGWLDPDGNGCDGRNDTLARDLADTVVGDDGCRIESGVLDDPYTGERIEFDRSRPQEVQIDHIYPLAYAWRMGAHEWTDEQRRAFANDPDNLAAVAGPANQSKGDSGPGEWRPDNEGHHCRYAIDYVEVAAEYDLPVSPSDRAALGGMLDTCG